MIGLALMLIGFFLLMIWHDGAFLPSALRLIGSGMFVYGCYLDSGEIGMSFLIGGVLSIVMSIVTYKKRDEEITVSDGVVIVAGIIEIILTFVVGI